MNDLEKYEAVNKATSLEDLAGVIESFSDDAGIIQGVYRGHDAEKMAMACISLPIHQKFNSLTRKFGIRQQAMMLVHYGDM